MVVTRAPTRIHGARGDGKPPPKKSSTDKNVSETITKERRTKWKNDFMTPRNSELATKATTMSTELPS